MQQMEMKDEWLDRFLHDVLETHGYNFVNYARPSLRRRLGRLIALDRFGNLDDFRRRVLGDETYFRHFVEEVTVNVTEMFRDPAFYRLLRKEVLPAIAHAPLIRIWHAGCSTGEEVYSMAILLREAGLLHRSLLYATDINPAVLENLRKGIFPLRSMKQYSENYIQSGGTQDFSQYYTAKYDLAKFGEDLIRRMVISSHNLATDRSFNEFQLILCRNVLIYFDKDLQNKALQLFDDSLETGGFLALGTKESLRYSPIAPRYRQLPQRLRVWNKIS
ncbi:CheR family methyltransferase [Chitinophaga sp. NPDC101104]|uniref:CheR family methyltransferase n=1 Tax=Chitinophaga sp. NPDC101104 TaxID=3390561 RepID=UPI003D07659F